MLVFQLTEQEAANPEVIASLVQMLKTQGANFHIHTATANPIKAEASDRRSAVIAHDDRPDVGVEVPPYNRAAEAQAFNPAAIFAQSPAPQPPAGAPSIAGAGQPTIVPAAPMATLPAQTVQPMPAPPIVNVAAAQTESAAQASHASSVELDAEGLPWDNRIHSTPAKKNADGTWRVKRGLNDMALVQRVKAELRQVVGLPAPAAPAAPAPSLTLPNLSAIPSAPLTSAPPVPVPPLPPATTSSADVGNAPPAPPAPVLEGFAGFVTEVTSKIAAGAITQPQVEAACTQAGLPNMINLSIRPDLIPTVRAALGWV